MPARRSLGAGGPLAARNLLFFNALFHRSSFLATLGMIASDFFSVLR
jgi:hypothetical protein